MDGWFNIYIYKGPHDVPFVGNKSTVVQINYEHIQ